MYNINKKSASTQLKGYERGITQEIPEGSQIEDCEQGNQQTSETLKSQNCAGGPAIAGINKRTITYRKHIIKEVKMALPAIPPLASQLAPMLLPYLPYLLKGVKKGAQLAGEAVKAVGNKLGEVDWDTALKIWDKLRPQVKEQPDVEKRLKEVAENSEDPDAETLLSWELKKLLATLKPEELSEIQNIINETTTEVRTTIASGDRSVSVGGDAPGATFITGDHSNAGGTPADPKPPKGEG